MKFDFSDLVDQKLVTRKDIGNGLYLYKYARKVFYDNLWHLDSRLLEARGIVLDAEGNVVVWPFTKVFNRFENGTDVDRNKMVVGVRKVNGFMASLTLVDGYPMITTTGSADSEFAVLAANVLGNTAERCYPNHTYIFEICDESDPHIVPEEAGAYLIGARDLYDGYMYSEEELDQIAKDMPRVKRPGWFICHFGQLTKTVKLAEHEGFMVRDEETGETLMKIKSPHYLSKKALMRMGKRAVDQMFDNPEQFRQRLDEEFYDIFSAIIREHSKEEWAAKTEQDRRAFIEDWFLWDALIESRVR